MLPRCWLPRRSWRLEHNQCHSLYLLWRSRLSLPPILRLAARICSNPTFQQDLWITPWNGTWLALFKRSWPVCTTNDSRPLVRLGENYECGRLTAVSRQLLFCCAFGRSGEAVECQILEKQPRRSGPNRNWRRSAIFHCVAPNPRRALRPRSPCAVAGTGVVNAAELMILPPLSRFPQHRLWWMQISARISVQSSHLPILASPNGQRMLNHDLLFHFRSGDTG